MTCRRYLHLSGLLVVLVVIFSQWLWTAAAQRGSPSPEFRVDPFWPKPLPSVKDETGLSHQWVTGEPGATCIDSQDHVITVNRGFLRGGLLGQEGASSIPAPPIIEFDPEGRIVHSWGDATLTPEGTTAVLPNGIHGCFVDHENNIWLAGNADGIVQKWTHDGTKMLLQIGTKGVCDGPATPGRPYPSCGEPGNNTSQTLLNNPADIAVDSNPDPVTGERGSAYIADGYGNHRIVVFNSQGKYLRQWGSAGSGPGQFVPKGGGHPHCVVLGNDGLVYACDRGNNRIQVFDRTGNLRRIIAVDPPDQMKSTNRVCDLVFSPDDKQTFIYITDLGSARIWIVERESGRLVGGVGRAGHMAGELTFPHTVVADSRGNLYVSETIGGRRSQKFLRVRG